MKHPILIVLSSCILFVCVLFVTQICHAQFNETSFYVPRTLQSLWWSGQLDLDIEKIINANYVTVPRNIRAHEKNKAHAHQIIRLSIIKQILTRNIVTFTQTPYSRNANFAVTVRSGSVVTTDIDTRDDLDLIIDNALYKARSGNQNIVFSKTDIQALGPIYLRKSSQDLIDLGYQVVSSRYRTNYDASYRRHNIITAFQHLGHVRVLNPGDKFAYLASVDYDPKTKKNYKNGLAIVLDDEVPVYGGGLCGWSTAIYQWLVTNTALKLNSSNHSKRFGGLYTAIINGEKISTPGIDATIYARSRELYVTNISDHPVILAFNFNGQYGWVEEILSISLPQDVWSLEFVGQKTNRKKAYKTNPQTGSGYTETVKTGCYTWNINGKNKTSCYKEIR